MFASASARIVATFLRSGTAQSDSGRAFAIRGAANNATGTGAPSSRRLRATLALLALVIAALALTAAPASADTAEMGTISDVSYTSAHVTGRVSGEPVCIPGFGCFPFSYSFEYSTDQTNWTPGLTGSLAQAADKKFVQGKMVVPRGGTKYFVRLKVGEAIDPSAPDYPSFTTLDVDPPTIGAVGVSQLFSRVGRLSAAVQRPSNPDPAFDVKCRFEYISDTQFNENLASIGPEAGFEGASVIPCPAGAAKDPGVETEVAARIGCRYPLSVDPSFDRPCLDADTTYHLRFAAENAAPGGPVVKDGGTFTTAPHVTDKPAILAGPDVNEIGYRGAKVTGEVQRPAAADPALDTYCHVEYVSDAQFLVNGFAEAIRPPCDQTAFGYPTGEFEAGGRNVPLKTADPTPITYTIAGLRSGVTYHLRLNVENDAGSVTQDAASTFTTIPGGDPSATIDPNPSAGYTTASVSGTVTRGLGFEDEKLEAVFEYAEAGSGNFCECGRVPVPPGSGPQNVSHTFTGLNPDTAYEFRMRAMSPEGGGGGLSPFTAEPNPTATTRHLEEPTATIDPVTNVTGTTAHFSGTVDTHAPAGPLDALGKAAYRTEWHFECTPACPGNVSLYSGTVEGEEGSKAISIDAKGLDANTPYEVKLFAHNELYGVETTAETFTTSLIKPTIKQLEGASDGERGYTLQGTVNPNNSKVTNCKFLWGPSSASAEYAFEADCSPMPEEQAKPVTVEAHLTGLNIGARYHALLIATNAAGESKGVDQEFVPTEDQPQVCPNEALRKESRSLGLPECRAYEQVTPVVKDGLNTGLVGHSEDGAVQFKSQAGNLGNSGGGFFEAVAYVSVRSDTGWAIPSLNGPSRSPFAEPTNFVDVSLRQAYSADLRSSLWFGKRKGETETGIFLREPDGSFSKVAGSGGDNVGNDLLLRFGGASNDFSRAVFFNRPGIGPSIWEPDPGSGVWDVTLTGPDAGQRRRADVDNAGIVISTCLGIGTAAAARGISEDGRVIFVNTFGGCGGGNPTVTEVWARVDGTISYKASASQCARTAADPGGACNAPADAAFRGAATDGSRVFFTTTQQLLDSDTDQTTDLYACDIPAGTPAPVGDANPCPTLRQISAGDPSSAVVESFLASAKNGATVLFTATGVLADNEDALKEKAITGDHNLYLWRTDAAHPDGQTTFLARLDPDDLGIEGSYPPLTTPDGRYLIFATANQLVPTDTDNSKDIYRYDGVSGGMIRVSTAITGTGGNAEGFDVGARMEVTDDGSGIVFETSEALSPLDGNGGPDVYFWREGQKGARIGDRGSNPQIDGSGENIYFQTATQLSPADTDSLVDVYSAHVLGGFSFPEPKVCSGEACRGPASAPPGARALETEKPGAGNVAPQPKCVKGKVLKRGKCVKRAAKKHHGKKAAHKRGGGK